MYLRKCKNEENEGLYQISWQSIQLKSSYFMCTSVEEQSHDKTISRSMPLARLKNIHSAEDSASLL